MLFLTLNSPYAVVSVLFSFTERMNWKRIRLITENVDAYFFSVAELLLQTANAENITISPQYIELFHIRSAIHENINHNTK